MSTKLKMTERDLQKAVVTTARILGWRVAHFRPARVMRNGVETYETPVDADGKGFPDLVLVRPPRLLFWELKSGKGKISDAQEGWLVDLQRCPSIEVKVIRPADWEDGTIEEMLR